MRFNYQAGLRFLLLHDPLDIEDMAASVLCLVDAVIFHQRPDFILRFVAGNYLLMNWRIGFATPGTSRFR